MNKPAKPTPDFPLFPHGNGQWAKKIKGQLTYFGPWGDPAAALQRYQQQEAQRSEQVQDVTVVSGNTKSSKVASRQKKPHKDFPLYWHPTGQWAKVVRQRTRYFGTDADNALQLWLEQKDDLLAGREPTSKSDGKMPLHELVNRYLTSKKLSLEGGALAQLTYDQYEQDCERLLDYFGRNIIAESLGPTDFERYKAAMAKTMKPTALLGAINRTKMIFKYGAEMRLMPQVNYGPQFVRPTSKVLRKDRAEKGERSFTPAQIRGALKVANRQLKAMILLAINCGFGNEDCSTLQQRDLDLKGGWHKKHRSKTGVQRRAPLWPETVEAIKEALAKRYRPTGDTHPDLVFITRSGAAWNKSGTAITLEFNKILKALGIDQKGHSFYSLRRTFETIGEDANDQAAVSFIMGHVPRNDDMAAVYRQKMNDNRLLRVANFVHDWLFKESVDSPSVGQSESQVVLEDAQTNAA